MTMTNNGHVYPIAKAAVRMGRRKWSAFRICAYVGLAAGAALSGFDSPPQPAADTYGPDRVACSFDFSRSDATSQTSRLSATCFLSAFLNRCGSHFNSGLAPGPDGSGLFRFGGVGYRRVCRLRPDRLSHGWVLSWASSEHRCLLPRTASHGGIPSSFSRRSTFPDSSCGVAVVGLHRDGRLLSDLERAYAGHCRSMGHRRLLPGQICA